MSELPTTLTRGHKKLAEILRDIGFFVEIEEPFPPYSVDCYVEEVRVAFEYDGEHHRRPKQKLHDGERDIFLLTNYQVHTYRVTDEDFKDISELKERIVNWLETYRK